MKSDVDEILKQSTFNVLPGVWSYLKVKKVPESNHFMITQDGFEITVVTQKDREAELDIIERNKEDRVLICLNVSIPFYSVGFLAAISSAIANDGMNILIISTYSKDYILVKRDSLDKAKNILNALGLKEI